MSLIVETGTADPTAESYVSVVAADTYHANVGNTLWAGMTTAEKEQALRRATKYMVRNYRQRWKGYRASTAQALDWPRWNVYIGDAYLGKYVLPTVVPAEVIEAECELAILAAAGDLDPPLSQGIKSETVGPLSTVYDEHSPQGVRYTAVESLLEIFFDSGGSSQMRLTRC